MNISKIRKKIRERNASAKIKTFAYGVAVTGALALVCSAVRSGAMDRLIKYLLENLHALGALVGIAAINVVCWFSFLVQLSENGWTL